MRNRSRPLNAKEHARITEAIRIAEKSTSGEIYCVVARSSDSYFFPAAFTLMLAMLIASLVAAFALEYWWLTLRAPLFVAAQMLALGCALILLWLFPPLRIILVPRQLRYRRAHENALKQFLSRNVHVTSARTGVLIFVSLAERYAEIVADSGINSRVAQAVWDEVVGLLVADAREGRLADGFVSATGTVGKLLSEHFPVEAGDVNELDDHLVEI
ncbi:TPM domain-containing protein [Mesorhizobium sp. WSM2239]|uniref:TPM domain-containing protein n=2 Tax=unclassified Mesorhizobium TaxID=325217 RepID=A0AAU8DBF3_9HYPH